MNLKQILIAGILSTTACSHSVKELPDFSLNQDDKTCNLELKKFPNTLAGAREVKKYEMPCAKNLLVHIRQRHFAPMISDDDGYSIASIQRDIYSTLTDLNENHGLRAVYNEGTHAGNLDVYKKLISELANYPVLVNHIIPALESMVAHGLLETKYAENQDIFDRCKKEVKDGSEISTNSLCVDGREDALLEIIVKNKDCYAVAVYGGGHDWLNNVQKWNALHPAESFSLIVITPNSYTERE